MEAREGEKGNRFVMFFVLVSHALFHLTLCEHSILSTSCSVCLTAALKDRGNEAYAKEDFETAVKYYSEGLSERQDMQPLYTNRAQVISLFLFCFGFFFFNTPLVKFNQIVTNPYSVTCTLLHRV